MSEEDRTPPVPAAPEVESTLPAPRAVKWKPRLALKLALLDVIERKRLTEKVDYKSIAARHGTTSGSLRQLYHYYSKGEVDLGEPQTQREREIDARVQHEKELELVRRYKALVLIGFEGLLHLAEDDMHKRKPLGWQKRGMPAVLKELKGISEVESRLERGYNSILEDQLVALNNRQEKVLGGTTLNVATETKILHANDEERARMALSTNGSILPEPASAGVPE